MSKAVGRALGVEIDNYVVIGFDGVKRLVDAAGGVDVVLDKTIRDPVYWLTPTKRGVTFKAGKNHLNGERALIFARTRKADNDFERARRQQKLVAAAVGSVKKLGLLQLPELISIAAGLRQDRPAAGPGATDLRDRRIGEDEEGDRHRLRAEKVGPVDRRRVLRRSRSTWSARGRRSGWARSKLPLPSRPDPRSRQPRIAEGSLDSCRGPRSSVDRATAF